jgi:hypothetical protein
LAEVKHKGEVKLQHPEPLARGRLLHNTIHWQNRWATTPTSPLLTRQATAVTSPCRPNRWPHRHPTRPPPSGLPGHCTNRRLPIWLPPTHWPSGPSGLCLSCWSHTWQKKKKKETKLRNPSAHKKLLQHCQKPAPTCLGDADKQDWMLKK